MYTYSHNMLVTVKKGDEQNDSLPLDKRIVPYAVAIGYGASAYGYGGPGYGALGLGLGNALLGWNRNELMED